MEGDRGLSRAWLLTAVTMLALILAGSTIVLLESKPPDRPVGASRTSASVDSSNAAPCDLPRLPPVQRSDSRFVAAATEAAQERMKRDMAQDPRSVNQDLFFALFRLKNVADNVTLHSTNSRVQIPPAELDIESALDAVALACK